MSTECVREQFSFCISQILSPTSNKELSQATKWLEKFRMEPVAMLLSLDFLNSDTLGCHESIFISQILQWTSVRISVDKVNIAVTLPEMLRLGASLNVSAMRNISYAFTVLAVKAHIFGDASRHIVATILASYAPLLSNHLKVCIIKFIPEVCRNRTLYRGPKSHVDKCMTDIECSLLHDLRTALDNLKDCLCNVVFNHGGLVHIGPDNCDVCSDILSAILEWSQLSTAFVDKGTSTAGDTWVHSGVLDLVAAVMHYFWAADQSDTALVTVLSHYVPLVQACGEGINNMLGCSYCTVDCLNHVLTEVLGLYATGLNTTIRSLEIVYERSATSAEYQNSLESTAECSSDLDMLTAITAIALSDNIVAAYRMCRANSSNFDTWEHFLIEVIDITNRLQRLMDAAVEGLLTTDSALHERYYTMCIISVRIVKLVLSFWQNLSENEEGEPVALWHMSLLPNVLSSLIGHTTVVQDPYFMALRKDVKEVEFLWTSQSDDDGALFRRDAREFFRSVGRTSADETNLAQPLAVFEWSLQYLTTEITELYDLLSRDSVGNFEFAVYAKILYTEAVLHYFSAIIATDVIGLFDRAVAAGNDMTALAVSTVELLQSLLSYLSPSTLASLHGQSFWNLDNVARFLCRLGVVIVVDLLPTVLYLINTTLTGGFDYDIKLLWQKCYLFVVDTLRFHECIEWEGATADMCVPCCSVIPFRTKQDHIGCVSLLRMLQQLQRVRWGSDFSVIEDTSSLDSYLVRLHRTLCEVEDGDCQAATLLKADVETLLSFAEDNHIGARMTWKSFLILHDALCLQIRIESNCHLIRSIRDSNIVITISDWYLPVLLPSMAMTLSTVWESTDDSMDVVKGVLASMVAACDDSLAFDKTSEVVSVLVSLGANARERRYSVLRLCEVIAQTVCSLHPIYSTRANSDERDIYGLMMSTHAHIINDVIFPFVQLLMDRCPYTVVLMEGILIITIASCLHAPASTLQQDSFTRLQSIAESHEDAIYRSFQNVLHVVSYSMTDEVLAASGPEESLLRGISGATEVARKLLGWRPFLDISATFKIFFDEITSTFLTSSSWDSNVNTCSQYRTVAIYFRFFEFITVCLGYVGINDSTVAFDIELRNEERQEIVMFACHIWEAFLLKQIDFSDENDSTKFLRHISALLCTSLGVILSPQSSDLMRGLSRVWPAAVITKKLDHDMMYTVEEMAQTNAEHPHGVQYSFLLGGSVFRTLINAIFTTLRLNDLSFQEKEPILRLLMKIILCFGSDQFLVEISEAPSMDKKIMTALVAICSHAKLGNWRQFKNTLKAFAK